MAEGINTPLFADSALRCYYRFNSGFLTTDSKNSLTLTSNGSPVNVNGKFGNGVSLDTSSYFSRNTQLTTTNPFTFSINVWIKDYTAGCIFSAKAGSYEWYFGTNTTHLFVHAHWTDDSDKDISATLPVGYDSTRWNMITITADQPASDAIIKGYVNKTLVINDTTSSKNVGVVEAPYYLSYFHIEGKNTSAGKIDDFMFFENKILTTTEIDQLYTETGGSFIFNMI
jgi:hypothetical protein